MDRRFWVLPLLFGTVLASAVIGPPGAKASDHDDGVTDVKSKNANFTDLFVFTEKSQNPAAKATDLIFVMNVNPRSVPSQQFFFSTIGRYEFHVSRVGSNGETPSGKDDVVLRFEFGLPTVDNRQPITVTALRDGATLTATTTTAGKTLLTTTPNDTLPINQALSLGGSPLTVFAGTREDPFFFDVEQFFVVRDSALDILAGTASPASQLLFRKPGVDFAAGYNVLSVVARIPREFLQGPARTATTFDVWETFLLKDVGTGAAGLKDSVTEARDNGTGPLPPDPNPGMPDTAGQPGPSPSGAKSAGVKS
ncbi:MAG: DUF4331 family protein [Candidatus Sericytochromatia bacterium]|nr:DUF4331 family protein [Candidatus Sericytochromatia bacterium]